MVNASLPAILFGGSSLLAALACLTLPETVGLKLPEDLPDVTVQLILLGTADELWSLLGGTGVPFLALCFRRKKCETKPVRL